MNTKKLIRKMIGTPTGFKDNDNDGIINGDDCQKDNKKKQGDIHELGYTQLKKIQGNIPKSKISYDKI